MMTDDDDDRVGFGGNSRKDLSFSKQSEMLNDSFMNTRRSSTNVQQSERSE